MDDPVSFGYSIAYCQDGFKPQPSCWGFLWVTISHF